MGEGYEKGEQRMGDMKWEIKKKAWRISTREEGWEVNTER